MDSKPQQEPTLCIGNCGFFGNEQFGNMCSKCFKATQPSVPIQMPSLKPAVQDIAASEPSVTIQQEEPPQEILSTSLKATAETNRCFKCRTKLSLAKQMSNKCKCGSVFCDSHKVGQVAAGDDVDLVQEAGHRCDYDFAQKQKDLLEKRNPKVIAERGSFTRI